MKTELEKIHEQLEALEATNPNLDYVFMYTPENDAGKISGSVSTNFHLSMSVIMSLLVKDPSLFGHILNEFPKIMVGQSNQSFRDAVNGVKS